MRYGLQHSSANSTKRGFGMLKLLMYCAFLVAVAALLACSNATPTPASTSTPAPTATAVPTPAPTAAPELVETPVPTAAPTSAASAQAPSPQATSTTVPTSATTPAGVITPLGGDPEAVMSELSEAELECLGDGRQGLARALTSPESVTQEEQATLIGCLEDETVGRMFLTGFVGDSGPLSLETSICVRAAFTEINPRAVMTAGIEGNPGAAMAGSMAGFAVTLACLNDEEWEAAAPKVGVEQGEQKGMRCLLEELGGPAEMASAMAAANEGDFGGFAAAGMNCGLDTGAGPARIAMP